MRFNKKQYVQALYESIREADTMSHDKVIENFIQTLKANGDLSYYEELVDAYEAYDKEQRGIKDVEITTAGNAVVNKYLLDELNKLVGKDIEVKHKQDDKIIGGVVIKVGDTLIDGSIENHLKNLVKKLKE